MISWFYSAPLAVAFQVPVSPVGRQAAPREMSQPRVRCGGFRIHHSWKARRVDDALDFRRARGPPLVEAALPFGRALYNNARLVCTAISQCWRWQASLQYLVLHLLHFFPRLWASGAAQAAQFVRIILVWRGRFERLRRRGEVFGITPPNRVRRDASETTASY